MTKQEFIERARKTHGEKFDYSKIPEEVRAKGKYTIICPKHGEFEQQAMSHYNGTGCPYCNGAKFCLDDFIERANQVWNNKYDYSKVEFVSASTPVTIICPEHGEFKSRISNHLAGHCTCKQCAGKSEDYVEMNTFEDFLVLAHRKYGDKFTYNKDTWKNSRTKMEIICPVHGSFEATPQTFLKNIYGCIECRPKLKWTTEEFINNCKMVHGDKYDYSKIVYEGADKPITVICPKHGEFVLNASAFMNTGIGCRKCANEAMLLDNSTFIQRAKLVHGDIYNYSKTNYTHSKEKITITCPIHGDFEMLPHAHLSGCGCAQCGRSRNISKGEEFILNYLLNKNIEFQQQYEIHIPNNTGSNINTFWLDFKVVFNDKLYCIEYNGRQHYEYIPFFHETKWAFAKQLYRDKVVKQYCMNNNIEFIEIKYDLSDAEIITTLDKYFKSI